ncbi:hypothetical protein TNCV_3671511 [Trichonephila clavipes]|nr:hypothetical protein TNCV_3671511 [Trichonephila clavipes]
MGDKMANRIHLSQTDIAKLIEASDSARRRAREEEVSEYENHTRDEIENESFYNDFNTNNQQMNHKKSIQSKDLEIKWKMNPLPHSSQSTAANVIKTTPRVTGYVTVRVHISAFEVVFNSAIENEIMKISNIEGEKI